MSTTATKNRIQQTFEKRNSNEKLMNLFVTAGYPEAGATVPLVKALDKAGADMIELADADKAGLSLEDIEVKPLEESDGNGVMLEMDAGTITVLGSDLSTQTSLSDYVMLG